MIVLMPNCAFLSETSRMLHIARALRARGREVAIATHGGPFVRVLEDAGEPFTPLEPRFDDARAARYVRDVVRIGAPGVRLHDADEVRRSVAAEVELLRARGARMVVVGFTLTAYLSSRVAGIPLAASHGGSFVPPVFERGLAPAPTTMPFPLAEWLPARIKRWFANVGPARLRAPARVLNEVAAELGVEPVPSLAAMMLGDLTLVTDVPEVLGIPRDELEAWRPPASGPYRAGTRLTYVGPLFARLDAPIPPAVEAFLDGARPTAYVALSSSTPETLRAVVARVRAAGPRVIVGATIHDLGAISDPDVAVAGILPSHEVMPRVDVAVATGGQGTVQTALASGTPFVGVPLQPEQEFNVGLAARLGAAIPLAPRHAGTGRLTEAVRRVLADPSFRAAAARARGYYAGVDGAANAARAIDERLRGAGA